MDSSDGSLNISAVEIPAADTSQSRREFTLDEEIALCNLIEEKKPMFKKPQPGCKWQDVKRAMDVFNNFKRNVRTYKDHYEMLLKKFEKNDAAERWSSGTAEKVTALKLLLGSLQALQHDSDIDDALEQDKSNPPTAAKPTSLQAAKKVRLLADNEKGKEIREIAMRVYGRKKKRVEEESEISCSDSDSSIESPRMKKKKVTIEEAMMARWERKDKLKAKELKLKEKELEVRLREADVKIQQLNAEKDLTQVMP